MNDANKGLGGKRPSRLWKSAGIDTIDALLEACKKGLVNQIEGFGTKTQENIINAIETYRSSQDRYHYASVQTKRMIRYRSFKKHSKRSLSFYGGR